MKVTSNIFIHNQPSSVLQKFNKPDPMCKNFWGSGTLLPMAEQTQPVLWVRQLLSFNHQKPHQSFSTCEIPSNPKNLDFVSKTLVIQFQTKLGDKYDEKLNVKFVNPKYAAATNHTCISDNLQSFWYLSLYFSHHDLVTAYYRLRCSLGTALPTVGGRIYVKCRPVSLSGFESIDGFSTGRPFFYR